MNALTFLHFQLVDFAVMGPELCPFLLLYESKKPITACRILKGKLIEHQGKEENPEGEDISFGGIVAVRFGLLTGDDFRGHIPLPGSFVLIKEQEGLIDLKVGGESKITDFECDFVFVFLVDEYILEFEIAMSEVVRVQIGDSLDNLPVELPLERVRRFACLQVEKE